MMCPKILIETLQNDGKSPYHFSRDNFISKTEMTDGSRYRYDFKEEYELWLDTSSERITIYKGYRLIKGIYYNEYPELLEYLQSLENIFNNSSTYCNCIVPTVEKRIMIVTYFDFCTKCRKEKQ